jgi:hypothetical protein
VVVTAGSDRLLFRTKGAAAGGKPEPVDTKEEAA